jgi:hypothetical protein
MDSHLDFCTDFLHTALKRIYLNVCSLEYFLKPVGKMKFKYGFSLSTPMDLERINLWFHSGFRIKVN